MMRPGGLRLFEAIRSSRTRLEDATVANASARVAAQCLHTSTPVDDEPNEAGFGLETKHFFEKDSSDEDNKSLDFGVSLNEDGRLRLRPDVVLEAPTYAGIKSTRKAVFQEDEEADSGKETGNDGMSIGKAGVFSHSEESSEDEDGTLDEEMDALNKEYEELQKEEEEMLKNLKVHGYREIQKGQAVSHQKDLWDKALEMRISLQKHFSNTNRLPKEDTKLVLCRANAEASKAFTGLTTSAIQTLDCLTDLLKTLIDQNSAITGPIEDDKTIMNVSSNQAREDGGDMELNDSVNPVDVAWRQIDSLYSRITPFRNNSVDRWQRKTQLSTGAIATKTKLRVFNQSVSQQIANFMRDPSWLIKRMQLKSSSVHVFGTHAEMLTPQANATVPDCPSKEHETIEAVNDADPELFDDSEFYQQLLREFLESSDPAALGNMNLFAVRKLRNKKRKVVDRRASKGRKIRYSVHEKIVNFMAPEPLNLPPMADKLFANLFGQNSHGRE